jgi:hypothetical protein
MVAPSLDEHSSPTPGGAGSCPNVVRFGVFEWNVQTQELRKRGVKVRVPDQPCQILRMLLERPGQVVTRDKLRQRLWSSDTFVDFALSLNSAVRKLREALGSQRNTPRSSRRCHAAATDSLRRSSVRQSPATSRRSPRPTSVGFHVARGYSGSWPDWC